MISVISLRAPDGFGTGEKSRRVIVNHAEVKLLQRRAHILMALKIRRVSERAVQRGESFIEIGATDSIARVQRPTIAEQLIRGERQGVLAKEQSLRSCCGRVSG